MTTKIYNQDDVLTTGQVAKISRLSQGTIIRCFDKGLLAGFIVPGSDHRRIPLKDAIEFLESNKVPYDLSLLNK